MKVIKALYVGLLCLITNSLIGQPHKSCSSCKMDIIQEKFKATSNRQGKPLYFDAIECLINYSRKSKIEQAMVTDYTTGKLINAKTAFYLKSKNLPSPMGAYLSAYSSEKEAIKMQREKTGQVMDWNQLLAYFNKNKLGYLNYHNHHKSDSYAPSGIMGDHLHPKGGLMISVQHMHMAMNGNRKGNNKIDDAEIYNDFMTAPQDMTMNMYMISVMYAPTDKLTLMLMQDYSSKKMNLTARMMMSNSMVQFQDFSTTSKGLGDTKLSALWGIWSNPKTSFHINTQINIPIGDIKNRDTTPMTTNVKLPYAMQLGTGTFDFTCGGTLKGRSDYVSWGIQQLNTIRVGTNSEGYRFGNTYELNLWSAYSFTNKFSTSLRLKGVLEGDISGVDDELNPIMTPPAVTENYGGELLHTFVGANYLLSKQKVLLTAALGLPLYQNYNGIFMNNTLSFNMSMKYLIL